MIRDQFTLDVHQELIIDNFAGGGGASTGIEMALGRCVDIAINHDPEAVLMHEINHPQTKHYCESVWDVNPQEVTQGRPVGLGWFSPDCKHFSKAKGGSPVRKEIRGLAWVLVHWLLDTDMRVFMLENVEEFVTWCSLIELPDGTCRPDPDRKGETFDGFIAILTTGISADHPAFLEACDFLGLPLVGPKAARLLAGLGCTVEYRQLRACDYGAPTIRKRLFLIGRRDGKPIVWPEPTHGAPTSPLVLAGVLKPWRTAAECIDWSLACPSIFERKRELADATMKRIARGIKRYVIESGNPFIVSCNHTSTKTVYDCFRGQAIDEPVKTITASHGMGIVAPHITKFRTGSTGIDLREPMPTITAGPKLNPAGAAHALGLVAPFLTEHANGSTQRNFDANEPLRTQCAEVKGGHFAVVAPTLIQSGYGEREGQAPRSLDINAPVGTVVAGGVKHALVGAFLAKHYGGHYDGPGADLAAPAPTVTTVDHNALVAAQLVGCGGRAGQSRPRDASEPAQTLTAKADTCLAASTLIKLRNNQYAQDTREPAPTLTAGGGHIADVRAFLIKYYSEGGQDQSCADPMHTIPCHDRIGLVTVAGEQYVIADIGMRMLEPHELYAAQGFPSTYIIAPTVNGRRLPKHAQVRMCGNSVSPPLAAALARANVPELAAWTPKEAKAQKVAA